MQQAFKPFPILAAIALLALTAGCASTGRPTRDLLTEAGFRPFPADTPKKQELLKSLPTDQVSLITWKGKKLYVEPDVPNNRAYVGMPEHYEKFRELRYAQRMNNDNLLAAEMQRDAMMHWNDWGSTMYGGVYARHY
jgi:hypothetical protein